MNQGSGWQIDASIHTDRMDKLLASTGHIFLAMDIGKCIQEQSTECIVKTFADSVIGLSHAKAVARYGRKLLAKGQKIIGNVLRFAGKHILSKVPVLGIGIDIYDLVKHANAHADAITLTVDAINLVASAAQVLMLFVPGTAVACPPCGTAIAVVAIGASVIGEAVIKARKINADLEAIRAEITLSKLTQFHLGAASVLGDNGIDLLKNEIHLLNSHRNYYDLVSAEVDAINVFSKTVPVFEVSNRTNPKETEVADQNVDLRETNEQLREVYKWAYELQKDHKTNEITSINLHRADVGNLERLDRAEYKPSSVKDFINLWQWWCLWCENNPIAAALKVDKRKLLHVEQRTIKLEDAMRVYGGYGKPIKGHKKELHDVIALGDGRDTGISDPRHKAIFIIADGLKLFQGSDQDDVFFVFAKDKVAGWLYGRHGNDLVRFSMDIDNIAEVELSVADVEYVVGRDGRGETINIACDTKFVDLKGGDFTKRNDDVIRIYTDKHHVPEIFLSAAKGLESDCAARRDSTEPFSEVTIVVRHSTTIHIYVKGSFNYILADYNLEIFCYDGCEKASHFIKVPYYREEVKETNWLSNSFKDKKRFTAYVTHISVLANDVKYMLRLLCNYENHHHTEHNCITPIIIYKK